MCQLEHIWKQRYQILMPKLFRVQIMSARFCEKTMCASQNVSMVRIDLEVKIFMPSAFIELVKILEHAINLNLF